ncbi:Sodium/hydrogen exchanger [Arachis hypogaea]|nr:Sodium/hydrogen exchanger [Arachis hypogaea]
MSQVRVALMILMAYLSYMLAEESQPSMFLQHCHSLLRYLYSFMWDGCIGHREVAIHKSKSLPSYMTPVSYDLVSQVTIWWSSLMRGAVSIAVAYNQVK